MRSATLQTFRIGQHQPLSPDEIAQFGALLERVLGGRHDRDRNFAAWVAGVAAARGGTLRVGDISEASGGRANAKQLRHAVERAPMCEASLRQCMLSAAPLSEVRAFSLEQRCVEFGDDRGGIDIYSIHAVVDHGLIPLGWVIEPIPPDDEEGRALGITDVEERAVMRLLRQTSGDYLAIEPVTRLAGTGPPPVILQSASFGENKRLRVALRNLIGEYVARVDGSYSDLVLRSDPYESVEPSRQLEDYYGRVPEGADPPPREILDDSQSRHGREYALPLPEGDDVGYAIVRPLPPVPRHGLQGRLPERRARELGQLAMEIGDTRAADRLRVADLRHPNPAAIRRHALLMSLLSLFRAGRL